MAKRLSRNGGRNGQHGAVDAIELDARGRGFYGEAVAFELNRRGRPEPSPEARRVGREQTVLEARALAVAEVARSDRALAAGELARGGLLYPLDTGTPEAGLGRVALRLGSGELVKARRSPLRDPRFRLDEELRSAGERFERLAADAGELGAIRGCLWDRAERGGEPDADLEAEARARMVKAARAYHRIAGQVPHAPELATGLGRYSEWDVLRLVVLEGVPLTAIAGGKGRKGAQAREMLIRALGRILTLV